jgi:DNA-binding HxlR family transcriptional regulator
MTDASGSRMEEETTGSRKRAAVATMERPKRLAAPAEATMARPKRLAAPAEATMARPPVTCCPRLHEAVELVGKRWTGAILAVMLQGGPMRFSQIAQAVPALSDRLLSERMKELEARGMVERRVGGASPARVVYELTPMGRDLAPALDELEAWAHRWLD